MWISALLAASGLAAVAASSTQCVTRDICFGLAVPASTGFAGRGNVYMTITAAHSVQWVALGQGTRMAAANMFVVYPSANGSSVTLSNRLGTDHTQPAQRAGSRAHLSSAGLSASGQLSAGILCQWALKMCVYLYGSG